MIKPIVKDVFFLGHKFSGWTVQIILHELDYPNLEKIQTFRKILLDA